MPKKTITERDAIDRKTFRRRWQNLVGTYKTIDKIAIGSGTPKPTIKTYFANPDTISARPIPGMMVALLTALEYIHTNGQPLPTKWYYRDWPRDS